MLQDKRSSYRDIMKGAVIFGGVQVFQLLITILRGKIVAIFLGPSGTGITALFSSTINIITQFSSLGLGFSAVRDISQANQDGDLVQMSRVIKVFRRWVWLTGFLGGMICLVFARQFSEIAFKDSTYTWGFIWLSVSLLLNALATGETTLLQGTRQLQSIAKSTVIGSLIGLVSSVPLYHFYHFQGIVPGIIIGSLCAFVVNRYFAQKVKLENIAVTLAETLSEGQQMARLGIVLMVSQVIGTIVVYVVNAFISQRGGIADVGLYQSATLITSHSLGLIFNSMAMDYFPRLSAISDDASKIRTLVNQQCVFVVLIITPLLVGLIAFSPFLFRILLSAEYLPAIPLVQWISLGMILKAAAYTLGYISFAKGDKKTFFWLEGIYGNLQLLIFNVLGYIFWGLEGLGISFLVGYVFYIIVLIILVYKRYEFSFTKEFVWVFILQILICAVMFLLARTIDQPWIVYLSGLIMLVGSLFYSWYELDKRIGIKNLVQEKLGKIKAITA